MKVTKLLIKVLVIPTLFGLFTVAPALANCGCPDCECPQPCTDCPQ